MTVQCQSDLLEIVLTLSAASRACWTAGNKSEIKIAMIAITTSSSINVKPDL